MFGRKERKPVLDSQRLFGITYDFINPHPQKGEKIYRVWGSKEKLFKEKEGASDPFIGRFRNWFACHKIPSVTVVLTTDCLYKEMMFGEGNPIKRWYIDCIIQDGGVYVCDRYLFDAEVPYEKWLQEFRRRVTLLYGAKVIVSVGETIRWNIYAPGSCIFSTVMDCVTKDFPLVYNVFVESGAYGYSSLTGNVVLFSEEWEQEGGFPLEMQQDVFKRMYDYISEKIITEMIRACHVSPNNPSYYLVSATNRATLWKNFGWNNRV